MSRLKNEYFCVAMGYFIHKQAIIEQDVSIGEDTRIWANAHILKGVKIGSNCNICDGVFIESGVIIGDRVTIKCGVYLWNGCIIEDDVFIGPNATFCNDKHPRSKNYLDQPLPTILRAGASIGSGAVILPNLEIGYDSMVGAGSVVTKNVPQYATVVGNPAKILTKNP